MILITYYYPIQGSFYLQESTQHQNLFPDNRIFGKPFSFGCQKMDLIRFFADIKTAMSAYRQIPISNSARLLIVSGTCFFQIQQFFLYR